jgi:2-polyprenyl-3-methyl-5-hydroxy-6-metoxy-1,4-benzoquinol methylase
MTRRVMASQELISHPEADVTLEPLEDGKHRLEVRMLDPATHVWKTSCETTLPRAVLEALLAAHGPAGLCEVLARIEDPAYVQRELEYAILSFVPREQFKDKRILDFGCGSGASTVQLARMFADTDIVGVDLIPEYVGAARVLAEHLALKRLSFVQAGSLDSLGLFDFVTLNAVYEHLLPAERESLLPQLWSVLVPGGTLFMNMCPYRWYPIEHHTTFLPGLNYLPDWLALRAARRFAGETRRGISRDANWEDLLRGGIRGATEGEIIDILRRAGRAVPLKPQGYEDGVDLWYAKSMERRPMRLKIAMRFFFKLVTRVTRSTFAPDVTMAVRKG